MPASEDKPPKPPVNARLGELLQNDLANLAARYVARVRSDPLIPKARSMPNAVVEDHAVSFLADLFQAIVLLERQLPEADQKELIDDGTSIQRIIAELHGKQRHRRGFTEAALEREYQIMREEAETLVRLHAGDTPGAGGVSWALEVVDRYLNRARDASLVAFRAAGGK